MENSILPQNSTDKIYTQQVENVKKLKRKLIKALNRIEYSNFMNQNSESLKKLWITCDQMSLKLNVCFKIYNEIQYNRILLKNHISDTSACNEIRKRLLWLEEQLKLIIYSDNQMKENQESKKDILHYLGLTDDTIKDETNEELRIKSNENSEINYELSSEEFNEMDKLTEKSMNDTQIKSDKKKKEKYSILADDYLQKEHHRFTYSNNVLSILKDNPSSYHFLALPMTDSYAIISPNDPDLEECKSESSEMHKDLMDVLLNEIHKITENIKEKINHSIFPDIVSNKDMKILKIKQQKDSNKIDMDDIKVFRKAKSGLILSNRRPKVIVPPIMYKNKWRPNNIITFENQFEQMKTLRSTRSVEKGIKEIPQSKMHSKISDFNKDINLDLYNWKDSKWKKSFHLKDQFENDDLRNERIRYIVESNLDALNASKKIYGAKILSSLKAKDEYVIEKLIDLMKNDQNIEVQLEALRTLIALNIWNNDIVKMFSTLLPVLNDQLKIYVLSSITEFSVVENLNKDEIASLKVLMENMLSNKDLQLSYSVSMALGNMGIQSQLSINILLIYLNSSLEKNQHHQIFRIINTLVNQFHFYNDMIIDGVLHFINKSFSWIIRIKCINLIFQMDLEKLKSMNKLSDIVQCLERSLWNDSRMVIRERAGQCIVHLGVYQSVYKNIVRKLESSEINTKLESVTSIASLKCCDHFLKKKMLEILEIDNNPFIRSEIIKTFRILNIADKILERVIMKKS